MRSKHYRVPMYGILAATALLLGGAATAVPASAAVDPAPIGPRQFFTGVVNGATEKAVIQVVCPGPVGDGRTGHPVAGQSVYVTQAASTSTLVGYTGEAATGVVVDFGVPSTSTPLILKAYEAKAEIPAGLNLPCGGTGKVVFTPAPTSSTARPSVVEVTYENIAV